MTALYSPLKLSMTREETRTECLLLWVKLSRTLIILLCIIGLSLPAVLLNSSSPGRRVSVMVTYSPTPTLAEQLPHRPPLGRLNPWYSLVQVVVL